MHVESRSYALALTRLSLDCDHQGWPRLSSISQSMAPPATTPMHVNTMQTEASNTSFGNLNKDSSEWNVCGHIIAVHHRAR